MIYKELIISWQHENNNDKNNPSYTKCIIREVETNKVLSEGISTLSKNDTYDKKIGRKVSLKRALSGFPKIDRKGIWNAYFDMSPKSKVK